MKKIIKNIEINTPSEITFQKFVHEINQWWPVEYTWSQEKLKKIKIDGRKNGLCTEIGPNGFRCDWGTVIEFLPNEKIKIKWQISPGREPIPNPDKASDVEIIFVKNNQSTALKLEHFNFENHGEGSEEYRKMMDSEQGWDYILTTFKQSVKNKM